MSRAPDRPAETVGTALPSAVQPPSGQYAPITLELIDVVHDGRTSRLAREGRDAVLGPEAGFRCAPLLVVVGDRPHRKVVVGKWHIWLQADRIVVDAVIELIADENIGWQRTSVRSADLDHMVRAPFQRRLTADLADQQGALTSLAKQAAERSRNSVALVRSLRLELQERVAVSMGSVDGESPSKTLPLLISLGIAVTHAQHEARDAVREGLWLWRDDSAAYHGYRRSRDLTLINEQPPADVNTRLWMRTHDAAVRQCEAMAELLGEEVHALTQMVQSAGVMAQIHDAESADTLNKVAGAAAVGIGLPSLGLAYYGADRLLALDLAGVVAVLGVILVPTLLAVAASVVVSRGHSRHRTAGMAVLICCLLLCLILPTIVSKMLHLAS